MPIDEKSVTNTHEPVESDEETVFKNGKHKVDVDIPAGEYKVCLK